MARKRNRPFVSNHMKEAQAMYLRIRGERMISYLLLMLVLSAVSTESVLAQNPYRIQPGDTLSVSVWKEPELTGDVIVHPDGTFTIPLVGEVRASNRPISEIREDVTKRLERYMSEPIVTIGLRSNIGKKIYIIGQVNSPGAYTVNQPTDVMQALSLASGMTPYAAVNKIRILRRNNNGDEQIAIRFRYGDVAKGENLDQNILLQNGDVVVVP